MEPKKCWVCGNGIDATYGCEMCKRREREVVAMEKAAEALKRMADMMARDR